MYRMLLIDEVLHTETSLKTRLIFEQIEVESIASGHEGLELLNTNNDKYDLITVSDTLPDMAVEHLLIELRTAASRVPIILLSEANEVNRNIRYYHLGANDIIPKPVNINEFAARAWNILKLIGKDDNMPVYCDDLCVYPASRSVLMEGETIPLTQTEFDLLNYLVMNQGKALSREQILSSVWGYEFSGETNLVDVYIRYLRLKIDKKYKRKFIKTVRGIGYMFDADQ